MKRILLASLLCAVLLSCPPAAQAGAAQPRLTPTKETENDNLRCYPLDAADCRFFTFRSDLLVLRPKAEGAELLRCAGKGLTISARAEVPAESAPVSDGQTICCYDSAAGQALVFSPELVLLGTYTLPEATAAPVLLGDKLYYTTPDALMELDMVTGLHRLVRREEGLNLTALLSGGEFALCTGQWESRYIRTEDGSLADRSGKITQAASRGSRVYLNVKCGFVDCLYLGQTMLPLPPDWSLLTFLPGKNAALVLREGRELAIYDLTTGNCLAQRALNASQRPETTWATEDGRIFFTAGGVLYQWEPVWETKRDSRIKISALYTQDSPNEKGLVQCRRRGESLESRYGLQLLLHTDAVRIAPKGVLLEPEHLTSPLLDTLTAVEETLGRFPAELVKVAFSGGDHFYLCPVRSIRVDGEQKLSLQFWSGRDCYLFLVPSADLERGVTQLLSPLLDRQVLMRSDAYDRWDSLNPAGFVYGTGGFDAAAFADARCLESPAADRAGLLYAAMEPGNRELFLSAQLQNKLRTLCTALRQIAPNAQTRPWEQYLWKK